ncbi:MAG: DUF3000 family protein [Propionibacteriales bacterium]|nr:DUF3000 family protein [Propionibacteriales bacterium]
MVARREFEAPPQAFQTALEQFRNARLRPEICCEEMPAPQRVAPYSAALSADVVVDGQEMGTGRIVLLHDPDGNEAWEGTFRCVAYVRADIEPEMVTDSLLSSVGWTWLTDALEAHTAEHGARAGTVTRVASDGFGGMADDPSSAQIEIRASWSPIGDITPHVEAWGELLCTATGLPPVPEGVVPMPGRRGLRGR